MREKSLLSEWKRGGLTGGGNVTRRGEGAILY